MDRSSLRIFPCLATIWGGGAWNQSWGGAIFLPEGLFCRVPDEMFNDAWNMVWQSYITWHNVSQVSHQKAEKRGGVLFSQIWINLRFRRLNNIGLSINERPIMCRIKCPFSNYIHFHWISKCLLTVSKMYILPTNTLIVVKLVIFPVRVKKKIYGTYNLEFCAVFLNLCYTDLGGWKCSTFLASFCYFLIRQYSMDKQWRSTKTIL